MNVQRHIPAILIVAMATFACSINFRVPDTIRLQTGPTVTEDLQIRGPSSSTEPVELRIEFGAGQLNIEPGNRSELLVGTATYNVTELKPVITEEDSRVRLEQGNLQLDGIPFPDDVTNQWDLQIGDRPVRLHIDAGAYEGNLELGGLAIHQLFIADGASSTELQFSEPNLLEMDTFQYTTGASDVRLHGLANANFTSMTFRGGAGNYLLDFSGTLTRDATVVIDAGLSNVRIVIPEGVNARVNLEAGLSGTSIDGAWRRAAGGYQLEGEGPRLTLEIDLGAGNLELDNS